MSDEERSKLAEEAKAAEVAQTEEDAKAKGPKPERTKDGWTCPNKWTYKDGACVKG